MARGKQIIDRLSRTLDLTEEPIPGLPLVEIAGDGRVLVENHMGVTRYSSEMIQVKVKYGSICVNGCGLQFARMTKGLLVISGRIDGIQILRGCR